MDSNEQSNQESVSQDKTKMIHNYYLGNAGNSRSGVLANLAFKKSATYKALVLLNICMFATAVAAIQFFYGWLLISSGVVFVLNLLVMDRLARKIGASLSVAEINEINKKMDDKMRVINNWAVNRPITTGKQVFMIIFGFVAVIAFFLLINH